MRPQFTGPSFVAPMFEYGKTPLPIGVASTQSSFEGGGGGVKPSTPVPVLVLKPATRILYVLPMTTGTTIEECRPQESSLHTSCVPPQPAYAASTLSYEAQPRS